MATVKDDNKYNAPTYPPPAYGNQSGQYQQQPPAQPYYGAQDGAQPYQQQGMNYGPPGGQAQGYYGPGGPQQQGPYGQPQQGAYGQYPPGGQYPPQGGHYGQPQQRGGGKQGILGALLDAIHSQRLLNVEEKAFRRVEKDLVAPETPIFTHFKTKPGGGRAPETSRDGSTSKDDETQHQPGAESATELDHAEQELERKQWRDSVLLDLTSFRASLAKTQFLLRSNDIERERYAAERERIIETATKVRDNNARLHQKLQEAQQTLALRKAYDALAEKITSNRALKPREEQQATIEKLHGEIADLERESSEYANTWSERREQFGKIVDEGKQLLRLIRDEKEEAERQEGLDSMGDAEGGTPKPSEEQPSSSAQTVEGKDLKPPGHSNLGSRAATPSGQPQNPTKQNLPEDTPMTDGDASKENAKLENGEVEEGEEQEHMEVG
ncbi:MAG: hypothetical protein M1831_006236 [Alyxoria varia]|nr:MAG: hypothetical protein M1831_006236 [Alyxoria varia]